MNFWPFWKGFVYMFFVCFRYFVVDFFLFIFFATILRIRLIKTVRV